MIIHAGLAGNLDGFPGCPDELQDFWVRYKKDSDYISNFQAMNSNGFNVMIKGHDHQPICAYVESGRKKRCKMIPKDDLRSMALKKDGIYLVNHGPWYKGWFAIIDTCLSTSELPILKYHRL